MLMLTRGVLTVALLLGVLSPAWANHDGQEDLCHQADVIFCDNFEGRPTGAVQHGTPTYKNRFWEIPFGINAVVTTNAAGVFAGSKGLQLNYPAGPFPGPGFMLGHYANAAGGQATSPEVYMRWYTKWSSNFQWSNVSGKHIKPGALNGNAIHTLQRLFGQDEAITVPGGITPPWWTIGAGPNQPDAYHLFQQTNVVHFVGNQWYCIEAHFKINSTLSASDGVVEAWINGNQVLSYSGLNIERGIDPNDPTFGRVWENLWVDGYNNCNVGNDFVAPFGECDDSTHPLNQFPASNRWHDAFVVRTAQRVGCLGSAPPPITDTTNPTQPTFLAAVATQSTQVNLTWTASTDADSGIRQYLIRRCSPTPCSNHVQISATGSTGTAFTDNTVQAGTGYSWVVLAEDNVGLTSLASDPATVTTPVVARSILATDDFNRANGGLGANWTAGFTVPVFGELNAPVIVANKAQMPVTNADALATYTALATPNDQHITAQFSPLTTVGTAEFADLRAPGVVMRAADSPLMSMYACRAWSWGGSPRVVLERWVNGTRLQLDANTTYVWNPEDRLRGESEGTTHRCYTINTAGQETLRASASDATHASGDTGIIFFIGSNGTVNDAQIDSVVIGGFGSTPAAPPAIQTLSTDATGFNETHSGTVGSFRFEHDCAETAPGVECKVDIILQASQVPAGRYDIQWQPGTTFMCLTPIDLAGVHNPNGKVCFPVTPGDVTAPVLSGAFPSAALGDGTTSTLYGVTTNEIATCRAALTSGVDYDDKTIFLANNPPQLQHSATATGLTDGSTTHRFVNCEDPSGNESAETDITITVNNPPSDTTPPAQITDFMCAAESQTSISCTWTAPSGDPVSYQIWGFDAALIDETTPNPTPTLFHTTPMIPTSVLGLQAGHSYVLTIRALDAANNPATFSTQVTVATASPPVVPPAITFSRRFSLSFHILRSF